MSDKVILFIDVRGRDDDLGGGSSKSLRLLLDDYASSNSNKKSKVYYLTNDFNKQYTERFIDKSINRLYIKFPKILNQYNHKLLRVHKILVMILYSLPLVNFRLFLAIKKYEINTIVFNESRAFLTFLPNAVYCKINNKMQTIKYIRGDFRKNNFLNKMTNKIATKIIVLAAYLTDGFPKKILTKTYILKNGIDVDTHLLDTRRRQSTSNNDNCNHCLTIINVGTITEYKGQLDLIKALVNIEEPNIRVKFIGDIQDDVYYAKIVNYINENELFNRISFEGYQKNMIKYYQEADLLIHTSYNEGVSRVLLEAQLNKVFVIASDIPGNLELIKDGFTGLTYEVGNIQNLVKTVEKFTNLTYFDKKIILENAKTNICKNYSSKGVFNKLMRIIND